MNGTKKGIVSVKNGFLKLVSSVALLLTTSMLAQPASAMETITIDAGVVDGIIPAIHGVNNGPIIKSNPAWAPPCGNGYDADFSAEFTHANIPQARTHGGGPLDLNKFWIPWPNFAGEDPADPANYNWAVADEGIAAQMAVSETYIRIGQPANGMIQNGDGCDNGLPTNEKPNDFDVFAQVCLRVMMHYLDGWDNGFFYDIKYLEIWNEFYIPEFWNGTDLEAAELYEKCYKAVKPTFPSLNIGPSASKGQIDFWQYVAANNVQMDFVSPHSYMTRPRILKSNIHEKPNANWEFLFAAIGMPVDTPLIYSEWNRGGGCYNNAGGSGTVPGGAFVAATLITMAELHPANSTHGFTMGHLFSTRFQIWKEDGTPRPAGVGLEAFGHDLYGETPIKIASTGDRSDPVGMGNVDFKVMAGKSNDNNKVNVLVAYYDVTNGTCPDNTDTTTVIPLTVNVNNLPWGNAAFTWERWVHTLPGSMSLEDSGSGSGGSFSTMQNMNGNVFELYKLTGLIPGNDNDADGLLNSEELLLGTDPNNSDTDGDGVSDFDEVNYDGNWAGNLSDYDPYNPNSNPSGTDLDALRDDTDEDGKTDGFELAAGSNPLDALSPSLSVGGRWFVPLLILSSALTGLWLVRRRAHAP